MVNQMLYTGNNRSYTFLAEEKALIPTLISLFDSPSVVIRGKVLLTFYLMFKTNLKWMVSLNESKFSHMIDKIGRDNYKYVQCCLIHLLELMTELVPIIQKQIVEELGRLGTSSNQTEEES